MKWTEWTKEKILQISIKQSAIDSACTPEDFLSSESKAVYSQKNPLARKYLTLPFPLDLTSYGNNVVASVSPDLPGLREIAETYIRRFPTEHCFETPNLLVLQKQLFPFGLDICFMAEYFLPDPARIPVFSIPYKTRILTKQDFSSLYTPRWSNALCSSRKELDVLGVGAYDNGELIGLAACSADCDSMWQIGVDVLPDYRKQGVASALTAQLAKEILERGKVPFYCCAWSNISSARNAVKSGFLPAWVQVTAKPIAFINKINASDS